MEDINMTFCNLGSSPVDGVELTIETAKTALPKSDIPEQMLLDNSPGQVKSAPSAALYDSSKHESDHMPVFTTDTQPVVVKEGLLSSTFLSTLTTQEAIISKYARRSPMFPTMPSEWSYESSTHGCSCRSSSDIWICGSCDTHNLRALISDYCPVCGQKQ
jgi:hypothetical protein